MSGRGTDQAPSGANASRPGNALLITVVALLGAGTFVLLFAGMFTRFVGVPDEPPIFLLVTQMTTGVIALSFAMSIGLVVVQSPSARIAGATGRRPVRLIVIAGITSLITVVHVVSSVVAGVAPLVVAGTLLGILGVTTASWILGARAGATLDERERARAESGLPDSPDLGWTPEVIRRRIRVVVVTFVVALAVSSVLAVVLALTDDDGPTETWTFVVQLSFTAAAIACIAVAFPAQLSVSPIVRGLDMADRKAINRRVTGKADTLSPDLEWRAARVAAVMRVSQPFLLAQTALIFVGIFVPTIARGGLDTFLLVLLVVVAVFLVAMLPLIVRQQRFVKRFAEQTRDLARSGGPVEEQEDAATRSPSDA
ncbi:hypothetical protein [Clavibacter sp. VKM Ac-2542]|uniref:hypothetical protein n=1 Tax=Clavibacter sp. VKM Ac-2542 TaxID=2783811 RepID=UPI00188D240F|nr:hypothetical protein [Clavibacter sp. VKM Ac-2542]MBF4621623.1 hypothetical protein [Clavibacter sp. VKM Ac-2542]